MYTPPRTVVFANERIAAAFHGASFNMFFHLLHPMLVNSSRNDYLDSVLKTHIIIRRQVQRTAKTDDAGREGKDRWPATPLRISIGEPDSMSDGLGSGVSSTGGGGGNSSIDRWG
jgi:hypothetical protein